MDVIREGLFEVKEDFSGYLLTNKCERCGISYFPRREMCIVCLRSDKLRDTKLSKTGKLYTYTALFRASPHFNVPLLLGFVDFEEEKIRVFAQLTDCKETDLEIGMDMELVFQEMDVKEKDKAKLIYKFRPVRLKKY